MARYLISIIRPQGYLHSNAFQEVAETLHYGLRRLGHGCTILENKLDPQVTNIVLGAHLLNEAQLAMLPQGTIVYNLEQLGAAHLPAAYLQLAGRFQIWDYSPINLAFWKQEKCAFEPVLAEIGYAPALRRIPAAPEQDIDVLFYGSINEHRRSVLEKLQEAGVRLHVAFGVYGQERDALIARAKIVLNLHAYEAKLFEIVRVSYLLANSKAVVSEASPDMGAYAEAVAATHYDGLVEKCIELLGDDAARKKLEAEGFAFFARKDEVEILKAIVGEHIPEPIRIVLDDAVNGNSGKGDQSYFQLVNMPLYRALPAAKKVLELGCAGGRMGELYKQEHPDTFWVGVDINPEALETASPRLDRVLCMNLDTDSLDPLGDGYDCIVMGDVIEHLKYPEKLLNGVRQIATPDATLVMSVPNMSHASVLERLLIGDISYDSAGILDSTHLRFFSHSALFKMLLDQGWIPTLADRFVFGATPSPFTQHMVAGARLLSVPESVATRNLFTYQMIVSSKKAPSLARPETGSRFSVIVPVTYPEQVRLNVLRSPGLKEVRAEVILCENPGSAASAFQHGARAATSEWLLYCNQDVYFPPGTGQAIELLLAEIPESRKKETLIGFAGVGIEGEKAKIAGLVVDREQRLDFPATESAVSIDEFAVLLHRDSEFRIDEKLGWHLWATDLCMQALHHPSGVKYATVVRIPLFHNSLYDGSLPGGYAQSGAVLSAKYPHLQQIPTRCATISPEGVRPAIWGQ